MLAPLHVPWLPDTQSRDAILLEMIQNFSTTLTPEQVDQFNSIANHAIDTVTYAFIEGYLYISPVIFISGFALCLNILGAALWTTAVVRKRTKRTVLMLIAALATLSYVIANGVSVLRMFEDTYGTAITYTLFGTWLMNTALHSSQLARTSFLIRNTKIKKIVEYSLYVFLTIYGLILFAIVTNQMHNAFFKGYYNPIVARKVALASLGFSGFGIICHLIFLVKTYAGAYQQSVSLEGVNKLKVLFNCTALFALLASAVFSVDIALVVHYDNISSPWMSVIPALCLGFVIILEFLMDYTLMICQFMDVLSCQQSKLTIPKLEIPKLEISVPNSSLRQTIPQYPSVSTIYNNALDHEGDLGTKEIQQVPHDFPLGGISSESSNNSNSNNSVDLESINNSNNSDNDKGNNNNRDFTHITAKD